MAADWFGADVWPEEDGLMKVQLMAIKAVMKASPNSLRIVRSGMAALQG
ncbi:MAG: hypothetical protein AAF821_02985 [Cyanobacteria bacterium P01_D01_bin.156]